MFVGIAGQHIKSLQHRGEIVRDNTDVEINKADIEKLKSNMFKLITIPGEEIIHVIPQEYTVDGEDGIQDPKGMSGVELAANFHVITAQVGAVRNIMRCVKKAGLTPKDLVLESFASAKIMLSPATIVVSVNPASAPCNPAGVITLAVSVPVTVSAVVASSAFP